jgi:hypothetical protein
MGEASATESAAARSSKPLSATASMSAWRLAKAEESTGWVTPSSPARRRIVTAAQPPDSASSRAAPMT